MHMQVSALDMHISDLARYMLGKHSLLPSRRRGCEPVEHEARKDPSRIRMPAHMPAQALQTMHSTPGMHASCDVL